jgi:predicted transcriptional regulator
LACLWREADLTAAEIRQRLAAYRPMSHASVLTLLKRLAAKNLVARAKAATGKAHVYRATRRPDPTYRRVLGRLVQRLFGGSRVAMVASLLDIGRVSPEDIQEMKELLRQLESKRG